MSDEEIRSSFSSTVLNRTLKTVVRRML